MKERPTRRARARTVAKLLQLPLRLLHPARAKLTSAQSAGRVLPRNFPVLVLRGRRALPPGPEYRLAHLPCP
eukprot:3385926-Lingulodinium_polyedra.AAC.1